MTMPRKEKTILGALAAGAALLAMWIAEPPTAHADVSEDDAVVFCRSIDLDDSPQSFAAEVRAMIASGYTKEDGAELIDYAITEVCPEHIPALEAAIAFYEKKTPLLRAI